MGIHGIYKEIGPGERCALSRLAVEKFVSLGRPLRIAIDTSIWLFQIQSGKGGTNPALRTFYYRLLRLMSLSIHPLFVFDGPNKPPFKRHKRTGPNVASIPEFLAKQLLKQFGFPFHIAPGEAEAECALLQVEGIVDAVLSEDVDTLMFGSRLTLRNWSPEQSKSKTPTHVNVYEAQKTRSGPAGLDREGMVLVAMMSGGDYIPEGVPGCGPKTACEAARAGFGKDLCAIKRTDRSGFRIWREKLAYELRTNESKFFRTKHSKLEIPDDFPNPEVLGYYTRPAVSSAEKLHNLRRSLRWDQPINFAELRSFTGDAFAWTKLGGAKHFVRSLAPSVLVRELRLRGEANRSSQDDLRSQALEESKLIKSIHGKRSHPSTDGTSELRIAYRPSDLINIDLSIEEPDDEYLDPDDEDEDDALLRPTQEAPGSPAKTRAPTSYNPNDVDKLWVFEAYIKTGVPLKVQDWEESQRDARKYLAMKQAAKATVIAQKTRKKPPAMPQGALHKFTRVTKLNQREARISASLRKHSSEGDSVPMETLPSENEEDGVSSRAMRPVAIQESMLPAPESSPLVSLPTIDVLDLSLPLAGIPALPASVTRRRKRAPLRRTKTDTSASFRASPDLLETNALASPSHSILEDDQSTTPAHLSPGLKRTRIDRGQGPRSPKQYLRQISSKPSTPRKNKGSAGEVISVPSSPAVQQTNITRFFSPTKEPRSLDLSTILRGSNPPVQGRELRGDPKSVLFPDVGVGRSQRVLRGSKPASVYPPMPTNTIDLVSSSPIPEHGPDSRSELSSLPFKAAQAALGGNEQQPQPLAYRNPSTFHSADVNVKQTPTQVHSAPSALPITPANQLQRREIIRLRDSLPGAFAMEEVDLSSNLEDGTLPTQKNGMPISSRTRHGAIKNEGQRFRLSNVSFLDLTGG